MDTTEEELIEFTAGPGHLDWIHGIERSANRRLTTDELLSLRDLSVINNFDSRLESLSTLVEEINEASKNFIEGILPSA
jgi:phosphopantetheine adenylyltransferase